MQDSYSGSFILENCPMKQLPFVSRVYMGILLQAGIFMNNRPQSTISQDTRNTEIYIQSFV